MNKNPLIADHKTQKSIALVLIFFILIVFLGSIFTGFISPDSWNYLKLSTSIISGDGCQVNGKYFAVFPCGYPALISLVSLTTGLDVFISSKVINLLLILSSAYLFYSLTKSILATFVFVVNPITLHILQYTWSENVFILAVTLLTYSLVNIHRGRDEKKLYIALFLGLLLGVTSRYFFGPYAFAVFVITYSILGRDTAVKALPYFVLSGVIFVTYYIYNKAITGYGSGMPRIPAPESLLLLSVSFIKYSIKQLIVSVACLAPLLVLVKVRSLKDNINTDHTKKLAFFLLSLGIAYLILAFALRVHSQYDLYGTRTVGFGYVLILTSIIYLIFKNTVITSRHILALLLVGFLSTGIVQRKIYFNLYNDIRDNDLHSLKLLDKLTPIQIPNTAYLDNIEDNIVVIPFGLPQKNWSISTNSRLYYPLNYTSDYPKTAPYWEKEDKDAFLNRMRELGDYCYLDFTRVNNIDDLNRILEAKHPVDISFSSGLIQPELIYEHNYDEALASYFRDVFKAGEFVKCTAN